MTGIPGPLPGSPPKEGGSFAFARYSDNGVLEGMETKEMVGSTSAVIEGMTLQPDGKILAVGNFTLYRDTSSEGPLFAVLRYNPDGTLDPTFGTGGVVTDRFMPGRGSEARAIAVVDDGVDPRILVAGTVLTSPPTSDFALACYALDGGACVDFGDGGKVTTVFLSSFSSGARTMAVDPTGKILAGGYAEVLKGRTYFALARYNRDGSLDKTFGTGGKTTADVGGIGHYGQEVNAMTLQPDGKIIVAGMTGTVFVGHFVVARFESNGVLDPAFGVGGKVLTEIETNSQAHSVVVQPDGKIVLSGESFSLPLLTSHFALVRYSSTGVLDPSFGTGGIVTTTFGVGAQQQSYASALQPDGKIVVVGKVELSNMYSGLARYCLYQTVEFPVADEDCEDSQPPNPQGTPNPSLF